MSSHCVWIITVGGISTGRRFVADYLIKDHYNMIMLKEGYIVYNVCFNLKSFFSLALSGDWVVGEVLNSKDLTSEVYKSKFQQQHQLASEWLLEYRRPIERKEAAAQTSGTQNEIEQEKKLLQKQLDDKQDIEQGLRKQLKAYIDKLQKKEKEMKEQHQQQLKEIEEKDLQLTLSKKKESDLHFKLNKKQEEFTKKEKVLSELQQLYHSKKEELTKTENEFRHQLGKKEQKIQEYIHLLQVNKKELEECQDALRTQQLKNETLSHLLEDMERTLELKEKKIQERADILYQQKVDEFFLNAHKVNHISQSTQCSIKTADSATQVQEGNIFNELI